MKRTTVVVLLAATVAAAIVLWPPRPTWRCLTPGRVAGVSADGGRVFVGESLPDGVIRVRTFATATGEELPAVTLRDLDPRVQGRTTVAVSPDGRRAVAYLAVDDRSADRLTVGSLHDAATGARLGPVAESDWPFLHLHFSPRGRWLNATAYDPLDGDESMRIDLIDAATGDPLPPLPAVDGVSPVGVLFRGDDTAVALVGPAAREAGPVVIELRALPSFALVGRLTAAGPFSLAAWRGDRLTLAHPRNVTATSTDLLYTTHDTATNPVGPGVAEPHLSAARDSRHAWTLTPDGTWVVARLRSAHERFPYPLQKWAAGRGWLSYTEPQGVEMRVGRLDPATGATVGEMPAWLGGDPWPTPDGRWLVVSGPGEVSVWPISRPWPRGAWAMVAAGVVLVAGRGRKR